MTAKSSKVELSDVQLQDFCKHKGYPVLPITLLSELQPFKNTFVYTGAEPNQYNGGHIHHWMIQIGSQLFDSYGNYHGTFTTPSPQTHFVNRTRLQEFDSDVCGEYCCSFYNFYMQSKTTNIQNYKNTYELGLDRTQNDQQILRWYKGEMAH